MLVMYHVKFTATVDFMQILLCIVTHADDLTLIKTHGSESRGQEEAGLRDEPVSYLQVAPL